METLSMETDADSCINPESTKLEPEVTSIEVKNIVNDIEQNYTFPVLFTSKSLLELSHYSWSRASRNNEFVQPYLRGCKWSPDGTCCLSIVNNDGMHVTELPRELYAEGPKSNRLIDVLDSVIHVKEAGLIYDFCWYPFMNSAAPETCCWITTKQNGPVQMWDAFDGSLRSSYRGFNKVDELEPALSVTFTVDGTRIIAGYKKSLKTFDVDRPGKDCTDHSIASSASCLAVNSNLLAVGSWNCAVSLYNVSELGTYKSIGKMHGHGGGVTHMKFTSDGLKLVTGARKDHRLLVWDIRYYRRPLNILSRANTTNQRIYFDISQCGKYLVSGGTDGIVKVWDVDHVDWKNSLDALDNGADNATYKFPLHRDCCNSISIHPYRPILATGSGQIHLQDPTCVSEQISLKKEPLSDSERQTIFESETQIKNSEDSAPQTKNSENQSQDCELKEIESDLDTFNYNLSDYSPRIGSDLRYSSYAENSLVFWWTGDVPMT